MNKIFKMKNQTSITLDDTYSLEDDGFNGIVLVKKVEKVKGAKSKKPGEIFMGEDRFYFPRVAQALDRYVRESQRENLEISAILSTTEKCSKMIEKFDKEFSQFE